MVPVIGDRVTVVNYFDHKCGQMGVVEEIDRGQASGKLVYRVSFDGGYSAWYFDNEIMAKGV